MIIKHREKGEIEISDEAWPSHRAVLEAEGWNAGEPPDEPGAESEPEEAQRRGPGRPRKE